MSADERFETVEGALQSLQSIHAESSGVTVFSGADSATHALEALASIYDELAETTKNAVLWEQESYEGHQEADRLRRELAELVSRFARFYYLAEHQELDTLRSEMDRAGLNAAHSLQP